MGQLYSLGEIASGYKVKCAIKGEFVTKQMRHHRLIGTDSEEQQGVIEISFVEICFSESMMPDRG